ncbi:MAG: (2Fe-2S)-binding protein [Gammaproteobacteria bacterium]
MYVCICNNVTENDIDDAVRAGARTLDCLANRLAVSTCCGQCACAAEERLKAALDSAGAPAGPAEPHFDLAV